MAAVAGMPSNISRMTGRKPILSTNRAMMSAQIEPPSWNIRLAFCAVAASPPALRMARVMTVCSQMLTK